MLYQSQKSIIALTENDPSILGTTLNSVCSFYPRRRRRRRRWRRRRSSSSAMYCKVVDVNRVKKAGRSDIVRFRALVAVGNKKGIIGLGLGKNQDTRLAILSGRYDAKKNLVTIPLTGSGTISHLVTGKYGAARLMIKPASLGAGLTAGGSTRSVLQAAGVKDAVSKRFGSSGVINNAKATILALLKVRRLRKTSVSAKKAFRIRLTINGYHARLVENLTRVEVWDSRAKVVRTNYDKELNLIFIREPTEMPTPHQGVSASETEGIRRRPLPDRVGKVSPPNSRLGTSVSRSLVRGRRPLIFTHKLLKKIGLKTLNHTDNYEDVSLFKTELYLFSKDQQILQFLVKHFIRKFTRYMIIR